MTLPTSAFTSSFLLLCVALATPLSAQGPQKDAVIEQIDADVKQRCFLVHSDVESFLDLTHPTIFEHYGGRDAYQQVLTKAKGEPKLPAIRIAEPRAVLLMPPAFLASEKHEFVVVPYRSYHKSLGGQFRRMTFEVGVRTKGDTRFLYLGEVGREKGQLKTLFPDFPEDFRLPAVEWTFLESSLSLKTIKRFRTISN